MRHRAAVGCAGVFSLAGCEKGRPGGGPSPVEYLRLGQGIVPDAVTTSSMMMMPPGPMTGHQHTVNSTVPITRPMDVIWPIVNADVNRDGIRDSADA
jgi:hypothetical protein